ncbi:hypothetical protein [Rubripirellula tenax]|uniref:hypothetical protein n=1 Tax=Rubripirellula tenax TaxID=2528015 RepID=UPI0011B4B314|nr:hypothetical protein [Rubripirellula tenax]
MPVMSLWGLPSAAQNPATLHDPIRVVEPRLVESSGLAISRRTHGVFWTHNDSGGKAELFAFDLTGQSVGHLRFPGIRTAVDWEDMVSYVDNEVPRLLVADCGDNGENRSSVMLYLFDEPSLDSDGSDVILQSLRVTYTDGPRDCEAVAVDRQRRLIVMVTKSALPYCGVYTIPLPDRISADPASSMDVVATRVTTLNVPMVTGADFDDATGDFWIVNYFQAFRYAAVESRPLLDQLSALPTATDLPKLRQIEAVAVDQSSRLWITSEGNPTWVTKVPTAKP